MFCFKQPFIKKIMFILTYLLCGLMRMVQGCESGESSRGQHKYFHAHSDLKICKRKVLKSKSHLSPSVRKNYMAACVHTSN